MDAVTPAATSSAPRRVIGVVVESTEGPWFTQLLSGMEAGLVESQTDLMLASLTARGHYDSAQVSRWIADRRVDGILFASLTRRERPLLDRAAALGLPIVIIAPDEPLPGHHVVRGDNRRAGMLVAHHLADLGHTRIAFAGGRFNSIDSHDRLRGLTEGLAARARPLHPSWIHHCNSYYAEAGAAFARLFFDRPLDVTAVVLANDALALGFMRVALQLGVRVPDALSIVGFDGVPEGDLVWPGLTTVAQPMREMGRLACRKLLAECERPGLEARVAIELPMNLVRRDSTAKPAVTYRPRAAAAPPAPPLRQPVVG
jgi:LacI family transcriptional regulator